VIKEARYRGVGVDKGDYEVCEFCGMMLVRIVVDSGSIGLLH
jgi:hypothetical protein